MKGNSNLSALYSWPVIILALIIFWPVGVFLIIRRLSLDKQTAMGAAKLIGGLGIALYCIAVLGLIGCLDSGIEASDVIIILFFGAAGYALRRVAKNTKKDAEDVKNYLSIIVNGNVRQLDAVSAACGKPYDTVRADVQKMIDKGYLKNAYINESTREIVLPTPAAPTVGYSSGTYTAASASAPAAVSAPRVVTCSCCGANNTIASATGECEYCGAPIK